MNILSFRRIFYYPIPYSCTPSHTSYFQRGFLLTFSLLISEILTQIIDLARLIPNLLTDSLSCRHPLEN